MMKWTRTEAAESGAAMMPMACAVARSYRFPSTFATKQFGWRREARETHRGREVLWESKRVGWSPINAGRFTTIIDCSMEALVAFLQVPENMKLWDKTLRTIEILEDIETPGSISMVRDMAVKMPVVAGRDMAVKMPV
eukprot:gene6609-47047_t